MKINRRVFLIVVLLLPHCLYSQVMFTERSSYNFASALFSSMIRIGDTLYLSGVASDTSQNFAQVHAPKNFVALMDTNGNNLDNHIVLGDYKKTYETFVHSLIRTRDKGFALCGSTIDSNNITAGALLIKYDSLLNVQLTREYKYHDSIIFLEMQEMIQLNDGTSIIVGDIQFPDFANSIAIMRVDTMYNIMWWKSYDSQGLIDAYPSVIQLTDTTLLIGYEHNNEDFDPYAVISHTKFMIIDTAGNMLSQWQDSNDSTFAPYGLLKTKDGGYAYCGRYTVKMSAPYNDVFTDGVITKLNSNFQLVWRSVKSNTATMGINTILNQLHELPDGSLIATGGGTSFNTVAQQDGFLGWFVKVSANGDSIWSHLYSGVNDPGNNYETQINDFQLLPDGGIIGCGTSTDHSVNYASQQAWLIRLDSMGCLIPGCDTLTPTGLSPTLTNGSHTGIAVYPNPANSLVYLLIKTDNPNPQLSFNIYNSDGQLLTTEKGAMQDITYLLHVNNYAAGVYFVEVLNEGMVVATNRFIKE